MLFSYRCYEIIQLLINKNKFWSIPSAHFWLWYTKLGTFPLEFWLLSKDFSTLEVALHFIVPYSAEGAMLPLKSEPSVYTYLKLEVHCKLYTNMAYTPPLAIHIRKRTYCRYVFVVIFVAKKKNSTSVYINNGFTLLYGFGNQLRDIKSERERR